MRKWFIMHSKRLNSHPTREKDLYISLYVITMTSFARVVVSFTSDLQSGQTKWFRQQIKVLTSGNFTSNTPVSSSTISSSHKHESSDEMRCLVRYATKLKLISYILCNVSPNDYLEIITLVRTQETCQSSGCS